MTALIDHTRLHRTAKYFMDTGRVSTHGEAMDLLHGFGLSIHVGPEIAHSVPHQIALLTLVNLARRTFLAGVEVIGLSGALLLIPLGRSASLASAVKRLGARPVASANCVWPAAFIGTCEIDRGVPGWLLTWAGWRGGVIPARDRLRLTDQNSMSLAPAVAAAACAAEVFAWHAKDHPMAGKRCAGISLWKPGADWITDDPTEPVLSYLPSRLWLIGLGNLGQAFAWLLACLPYADRGKVELVLQDFDRVAESNDSTSLLSSLTFVGRKKSRVVEDWLAASGFNTVIEERRFGAWTQRASHEPGVALCGVDNALARSALGNAGFELIVEAGLGAGPEGFRNFSVHTFPSSRRPDQIWSNMEQTTTKDVLSMPAYAELRKSGLDTCGLAQLASRTVGVPFVGLLASALAMAEPLRRLNGGSGFEFASGSVANLQDIETSAISYLPYAYGHVPVATASAIQ